MATETDQQKKKSAAPVTLESKVAEEDLENYQLICGAIQDIQSLFQTRSGEDDHSQGKDYNGVSGDQDDILSADEPTKK